MLVDCANGAASATAPELFGRFKCYADFIHREPNGTNINDRCGSTHLESLSQRVVAGKYDVGVAFDGDADRCLMVDELGHEIDGDKIMAVCGAYMKRNGRLTGNTIVATVMSNLGLHEFCRKNGIDLVCTNVGDRNVLEKMVECGYKLGGEQSGHMIDVGYDMYLKLLEEAVLEERGEKPEQRAECAADLAVSANIPESYVPSQEQRMDLYRRIALVRTEAEADDLMDEVIDRFGDPPPSVYTLVQVALLRADAGKVGVTDISQKNGCLKFLLAQFDMQKVSALYARPEFKGRLKVDAGAKPGVILRLKTRTHVIEQARAFVSAWADAQGDRA